MMQTVTVYYSTVIVLLTPSPIIFKDFHWGKSPLLYFNPCLFVPRPKTVYNGGSIAPAPVAK
jgi:hypothetical protein